MAALADLALRRPWALLAGNLAALALALVLAAGAPGRLGIGLPALEPGRDAEPDLVIVTRGRMPVQSGPYQVALRVIEAQLRSHAGVTSVRQSSVSADRRSTSLIGTLASEDGRDRERTVEQLRREIDPGPLRLTYGGEVAIALEARDELWSDLWRLELLVVPLVLLALVIAVGPRLALAPALCAATAIASSVAGLRLAGELVDVSLLGVAPSAVLGLALGIEVPCLLVARFRDESAIAPARVAIRRTAAEAGELALPLALGATAGAAGLLATGLDQAPSIVLGCFLAAASALGSALVCVPATLALLGDDSAGTPDQPAEPALAGAPRIVAGHLAGSSTRTALASALVLAIMALAATPLLQAESRPFSAADLPPASEAAKVAAIAPGGPGESATAKAGGGGRSLFGELPIAAAVSAAALALILGVAFSPRAIPVALVSLLPAAAACGLCVLVFQQGHLGDAIGQRGQGAVETGAVASLAAALAAISATRGVVAVRAARSERSFGLDPALAAVTTAVFTVPAAITSTLVAVAATAVLAATDLYPTREFGLAIAAGLVLDLLLLRVPLTCAVARWCGSG